MGEKKEEGRGRGGSRHVSIVSSKRGEKGGKKDRFFTSIDRFGQTRRERERNKGREKGRRATPNTAVASSRFSRAPHRAGKGKEGGGEKERKKEKGKRGERMRRDWMTLIDWA